MYFAPVFFQSTKKLFWKLSFRWPCYFCIVYLNNFQTTLFAANKNSISLFQMIEDILTQNSFSEFMVIFDNEPTK